MSVERDSYVYETPQWAVYALLTLCLVISVTLGAGFVYWADWASDAPEIFRWLLLAIALGFALPLFRKKYWRPWRYFRADSEGIHLATESSWHSDAPWLSVPWEKVGDIREERLLGNTNGFVVELELTKDKIERHFYRNALTCRILTGTAKSDKYFVLGFSNAFQNPRQAVQALKRLRDQYTPSRRAASPIS